MALSFIKKKQHFNAGVLACLLKNAKEKCGKTGNLPSSKAFYPWGFIAGIRYHKLDFAFSRHFIVSTMSRKRSRTLWRRTKSVKMRLDF